MQLIPITPENLRLLAPYRDIQERDLIGRENMFIAEGRTVLAVLLRSARFAAESILVGERKLPNLMPLLEETQPQCPIYVAPSELLDNVAGFAVHRGILAAGRRRASPGLAEFLQSMPENALLAVLNSISNHDNVGSVFRNAAAFAADGVLLDCRCCDPLYRKSIRVSVGAALKVPYCHCGRTQMTRGGVGAESSGSIEDIAAALKQAGWQILAFSGQGEQTLAQTAAHYHQACAAGQNHRAREAGHNIQARGAGPARRLALLFGSEGAGLPQTILSPASPFYVPSVRIPIAADFDSLNIATACGIALSAFANPAKLR